MSKSPDMLIPRTRPAPDDIIPNRKKDADRKHPLVAFLEKDPRWSLLKDSRFPSLTTRIIDTAMEIHLMNRKEVINTVNELDAAIPQSQYLSYITKKRGTLWEQHEEMVKLFESQEDFEEQGYDRVPYRLSQIHLAERLLGRQIEADGEILWIPEQGFTNPLAQVAIDLCIAAVRDIPPPNIH